METILPNRLTVVLVALALTIAGAVGAAPKTYPSIPEDGLKRYDVAAFEFPIEAGHMDRLIFKGERSITMNPIPGMVIGPDRPDRSANFVHPQTDMVNAGLIVIPKERFAPVNNPQTLNLYLEGMASNSEPADGFEIIERPEDYSGPAKFRFLGTKPYSLRYRFNKKIDDVTTKRMVRAENWNMTDGHYYVFVIEAPEEHFESVFKNVKRAAGSMHFED